VAHLIDLPFSVPTFRIAAHSNAVSLWRFRPKTFASYSHSFFPRIFIKIKVHEQPLPEKEQRQKQKNDCP
jgi:hypothetical protein